MDTPDTPALDAAYWSDRWVDGRTAWRREGDEKPYARYVRRAEAALQEPIPLKGRRVLVPLCGDSPVLRHFFDEGCSVVGVEFHRPALATAASFFPELTFTETPCPEAAAPEACQMVATAPATDDFPAREVRLIVGDFFAACTAVLGAASCDLCYDRGSFVAIDPARREEYAAAMARVMRPGGRTLFVAVERQATGGPPFHTSRAAVEAAHGGCAVAEVISLAESVGTQQLPYGDVVYCITRPQ